MTDIKQDDMPEEIRRLVIPEDLTDPNVRARAVMDTYHLEGNRPFVKDLLAMKPIEASRALLDAHNAWHPYIAQAIREAFEAGRVAEQEKLTGRIIHYAAELVRNKDAVVFGGRTPDGQAEWIAALACKMRDEAAAIRNTDD